MIALFRQVMLAYPYTRLVDLACFCGVSTRCCDSLEEDGVVVPVHFRKSAHLFTSNMMMLSRVYYVLSKSRLFWGIVQ